MATLKNDSRTNRPWRALVVELLMGVTGRLVFAWPGTFLGAWLGQQTTAAFGNALGGVVGLLIAYPAGVAVGVWLGGRVSSHSGSFWAALLGAAVGAWAPLLVLALGLRGDPRLLWGSIALTSLIAALAAHTTLWRGARHPPT